LTRAEDLRACVEHAVAWVGFNFFPGSKRHVAPALAARLLEAAGLAGSTATAPKVAGVFVDPDDEALAAALHALPELSAVQLHGRESPERVAAIRRELGAKRQVWKAVAVATPDDVAAAFAYAAVCDLLLLDSARIAPGHAVPGGSGERFTWAWLARYDGTLPFALAGGVSPDNIAEALAQRAGGRPPSLIDVASGAESGTPGVKDAAKIAALAAAVQRAVP
jgi:phosphoribosylanthranilate isomerase